MNIEKVANSIKELFIYLIEVDVTSAKNLFADIKTELEVVWSKNLMKFRSIVFEKNLLDEMMINKFNNNAIELFELIKVQLWDNVTYVLDEIALFRKIGTHIIPVCFLTIIPERYPLDENSKHALSIQLNKSIKPLLSYVSLLEEWKAMSIWEWEEDLFDILLMKWNYIVCFNNFKYSLKVIEWQHKISSKDLLKLVETFRF